MRTRLFGVTVMGRLRFNLKIGRAAVGSLARHSLIYSSAECV